MSDLPEDVRRWPSDPFELLGVSRDVPPRELKRAYTHLIRTYKPEHAPEQFRRIREAYDKAVEGMQVIEELAKEHPVYSTVIALGVIALLSPLLIKALGFSLAGVTPSMYAESAASLSKRRTGSPDSVASKKSCMFTHTPSRA